MTLPFLDRRAELDRLRRALRTRAGALACLYGRRRVGKSRLLAEALRGRRAVYYVGDERDAALQRAALAREMGRLLPGFDAVAYDDWEPLLARWRREAPAGAVLAIDEFPLVVAASPELPSLLQKHVDAGSRAHVVLCGSSQRMMQGLLLDSRSPLYGRAREILRVAPLPAGWIGRALGRADGADAVADWAVWGGIPRYWELALPMRDRRSAVRELVLDPLGVLHREPDRLLRDDLAETARASSVLALIGQGCRRLTEIGARLGLPATSMSRPLARLVELGLIEREVPFGRSVRDTKRTMYRIDDPFLRFWFRFVEPNRSRLAAGGVDAVVADVERAWPAFLGEAWEDLARRSVPHLRIGGRRWGPASRWWGTGTDGRPLELDVVAGEVGDARAVLVGEVKSRLRDPAVELRDLTSRAARCPELQGKRVTCAVWALRGEGRSTVGPATVLRAFR